MFCAGEHGRAVISVTSRNHTESDGRVVRGFRFRAFGVRPLRRSRVSFDICTRFARLH